MYISYDASGKYMGKFIKNRLSVDEIRQRVTADDIIVGGNNSLSEMGIVINKIMEWDVPETITLWINPKEKEKAWQAYVTMAYGHSFWLLNDPITEAVVIRKTEIPRLFDLMDYLREIKIEALEKELKELGIA